MKVRLTLTYEREGIDIEECRKAIEEGDDQFIRETFYIGWYPPLKQEVEEVTD